VPRGLPADNPSDPDSVRHVLFRTLPGRALVAGGAIRLVASLIQLAIGRSPAIDAVGTVGTLTLLVAIGYFSWRFIARAKRQLLWRVRRKLILSYIFVGLVPVLLAIIFFALCGVLLFMSISSYVVQTRLRSVTEQATFLARAVAMDVSQGLANGDVEDRLERKQHSFATRFPDASLAVVPVARTCASDVPGEPVPVPLRHPQIAGPWSHVAPVEQLPRWIGCSGFSGLMAYWDGSPEALDKTLEILASRRRGQTASQDAEPAGETKLFVRAVALPEGPAPTFAVVLDLPINDLVAVRLQEETGIELRGVALLSGNEQARPIVGRPSARPATASVSSGTTSRAQPNWVVLLAYTDWRTGRTGTVTQSFGMRIGEIYDRLLPSNMPNGLTFGQLLMAFIVVVGLLFLVIQFVALVMGLALARSITGSVHELFVGTERVRQGDFTHQIQVRARDQLGELADSFNNMTGRLGQLLAEMTEKKRLEEELRIARNMQMSLLPQRPPVQLPGITLTALCAPAREVGGDYYDFLPLPGNRLGLLIADVSGKGTSAAFYMAELKGLVLSLCEIHPSPRELLIAANRIITGNLDNRSFITMTYAVLDLDARTMTFARAGHTPLLHLPSGTPEPRARLLVPDGMVVGLKFDDGQRFAELLEEVVVPLEPGDLFMFFTDGLSEQMNVGEDLFGEARLGALIEEHGSLPFDELRERIVREVQAFAGEAAQHDDMTFILLRVERDALRERPAEQAEAFVS
jgi:serine phosphatase RsbU (regulator of sigma subunit)